MSTFQPGNITLLSVPNQNLNVPQWWAYSSTADDIATVSAAGYFNIGPALLLSGTVFRLGDFIYANCSDGPVNLYITALGNITTSAITVEAGSVNTAAIVNGAVTAAKIASGTITTTQISGGAGITGAQLASKTVTTANLATTTIQYAATAATALSSLYATPLLLVAAPAAGSVIIPLSFAYNYVFATAQYTSGGVFAAQYGAIVHGAGQLCSATVAAATLNAYTANEMFTTAVAVSGLTSASVATGLYVSNQTGAFATGAGTIQAFVSYIVVPAS